MAQQTPAEDTNTDVSGLASSLLPPSGTFFSGWPPQQWQNYTTGHGANERPGVQQSFINSYHNAGFQNTLPDSPTLYRSYDLDRPLGSDEAISSTSRAQSDLFNAQIYQVCFTSYCGTLLTPIVGYERRRE